jgi:MHS family alpha-ketoglutarate permease-like MFS transporter
MSIEARRLKSIIGGSAGNLVEWYDWFAYASLAIYFAPAFFPKGDPTAQLLSTAAIFAVGFLMRPLGAWIMGIYGDRHGRKAGLALSVGLMFAGSLIIAIAPTYDQAGALSPLILLFARMLQGLSVGGEYGASATYLSEMATRDRRGFYSSFQYVTLIGGQLTALAVLLVMQAVLSEAAIEGWAWRIPFLIGALLALAVYLLRRNLAETAAFQAMDRTNLPTSSARHLVKAHLRPTILLVMMTAGSSSAFYAYTTYLQKFLVNTSDFDRETATQITALALVVFMLLQPLLGLLSDKIGRKPLLLWFGITGMIVTVPVFTMLSTTTDAAVAFVLSLIPLVAIAPYTAIGAVVKAEMFPAHIRTLGVALPYAIGNAAFGGTAETVALWLKNQGVEAAFYWYITALIGIATIAFLLVPDTRSNSMIVED